MKISLPTEADCKGCGACCRHVGHPMFKRYGGRTLPAEEPWRKLPRRLKREVLNHYRRLVREFRAGLRPAVDDYGEPCTWLQADGTCKHHEYRPEVCRDFEVGEEDCLRFRREQGIGSKRR
jgi:Fe-S-cluster containining protein